jgi:putative nucleotidyltransferase with HDIG domain
MTIAERVEHKRNSELMTTDHSTALILHDDVIRQSRIASILRPRGLTVTGKAGPAWEPNLAPQQPFACVVVQLSQRGDNTTDQTLSRLRAQIGHARIIALTPPGDVASARNAFRAGVWDCLEDSVSDDELADRIYEAWKGQVNPPVRSSTDENGFSLMTDPSLGKARTTMTADVSRWVDRLRHHLRSTYVESTMALVAAVEAKDPCTQSHSLIVADYAEAFGIRMKLPARLIEALRVAALLHDIGKIGVPDSILTKPDRLSDEEFDIVKKHPETALEILRHVSFLTDVKPMILHHHERFDGSGYPAGLKGDQIPVGARVLCVADALDTMLSPRSYKKSYTLEKIRTELMTNSGTQFDPVVAQVAIKWLDETPKVIPAE